MGATRHLEDEEVPLLLEAFEGDSFDQRWTLRNQALVWLGICTGFRISELLSLRVEDVYKFGEVKPEVSRPRRMMKNKKRGRTKRIFPPAQKKIKAWIKQLKKDFNGTRKSFLFTSNKGGRLTKVQAWRILNKAAVKARIPDDRIGTHTLRKTFANRMYDYYYDLSQKGAKIEVMRMLQIELDHEDISTTYQYMEFKHEAEKPDDLFDKYDQKVEFAQS
jgi:site-specific recombinase XerD